MSLSRKVLFNTLAQLINRLAISGSAFLVSLLIARFFGARGFGEYSKATTFIGFFYLFADFGLNAVVLRRINQKKEEEKEAVANLLGLRLISGFLLTLLALSLTFFLPYDPIRNEGFTTTAKQAMMVLSILILYQAFLNTANVVFQKHLRYELSTFASLIGSGLTLIAVVLLLSFGASLPVVLFGYGIGAVVACLILYLFVKKLTKHFLPVFSFHKAKDLIIRALPLGLTLIFNLVYFRADVFILTLYRTTVEVGTYGLAYKFFEFPLTLPTFFANSLYPILLERSSNRQVFKKTILKAALFLLGASLVTLVGFYLAAPLLQFIRGDFYPSIKVLRLLSFSMPVFFLSSLFMWILITFGKNKELLIIYFLGMIINLFLNLLFIPTFGVMAAAVITFISEFFILLASGWIGYKLIMVD